MSRPSDLITFSCTIGFVFGQIYSLGLSIFGLFRTGFWFFYIGIFCACLGFILAVVNAALYFDPPFLPQLLGRQLYAFFFYSYIWLLLLNFIISLAAVTIMVRWIAAAQNRLKDAVNV
jgi:hypothetical protein